MFGFTPNAVAFTVFGLGIRWYAILICTGMILGTMIAMKRRPARGLSSDDILDVVLVCLPAGIIGARAWYVFFEREKYHSLFEVINIRAGGLAIQGGLILSLVSACLICRYKKIDILAFLDTLCRVSLSARPSDDGVIFLIRKLMVLRQTCHGLSQLMAFRSIRPFFTNPYGA